MNRPLEGHGSTGSTGIYAGRGQALMGDGYAPLLKILTDETSINYPSTLQRTP